MGDSINNERVVINDRRVPISTNGRTVVYYKPLVESIHVHYPFGWDKQLTTGNPYPFNYQEQLFDRDLGWQYYRYRNYDPMVVKFWQVELLIDSFPWLGYVLSENGVTNSVEFGGLERRVVALTSKGKYFNAKFNRHCSLEKGTLYVISNAEDKFKFSYTEGITLKVRDGRVTEVVAKMGYVDYTKIDRRFLVYMKIAFGRKKLNSMLWWHPDVAMGVGGSLEELRAELTGSGSSLTRVKEGTLSGLGTGMITKNIWYVHGWISKGCDIDLSTLLRGLECSNSKGEDKSNK